MPERASPRRVRSAAATLTAVVLAGAAALTGCASDGGADARSTTGTRSPSPSPAPGWDPSPASLAAVGDSITRGFDACAVFADCPEVSWATGTDAGVRSLAVRLMGASKALSHSWNHAVSGARMAQLPEQMALAAKDGPELVTVMIGANDACRDTVRLMTPVADFRASF
ncbi:MAG TPA: SGNH/GDSL hydrolase family protein, partial [Streptomyces sp.]|uniref:SGNH/GDSL hydrolase family protein n=1 Tax=Streptomyces sp. TaxID=1931 RepID=UPI002B7617DC